MSEGNLSAETTAKLNDLTHKEWARALRKGTLLGQRCDDCGHVTAAPKAACARCGSQVLEATELPTTGDVYTETRLEVVPEGFDEPYQIALVTVGDARIMAHVPGGVEIGQTVALTGTIEADSAVSPVFEPN